MRMWALLYFDLRGTCLFMVMVIRVELNRRHLLVLSLMYDSLASLWPARMSALPSAILLPTLLGLGVVRPDYLVVVYLIVLYLIERPDDFEFFKEGLVFRDSCHGGGVVLLVGHDDVRDQGAFAWEEGAAGLQSHGMPHFAVCFHVLMVRVGHFPIYSFRGFRLVLDPIAGAQKSELCAHAEVRH